MPKILTSYDKSIVLPPEGSDEWLALLPGWSGWQYSFEYGPDTPTTQFRINRYLSEVLTHNNSITRLRIAWGGADNYIIYDSYESNPPASLISSVYCIQVNSYYYFRGAVVPHGADISGGTGYYVGRATSLEPQV